MSLRTDSSRPIHTAVLLAVGSELTTGETRDTNSGDIARWLVEAGVDVLWISSLPDRLETVTRALRDALAAADLVVTTGGLGPTPDDLTRESIAQIMGQVPAIDPELEKWLRNLFERRGQKLADINLKQAWLIPSARAIPNGRGTAPGWLVETPGGSVIVALPGPPREMTAMWREGVLPLLQERGLGRDVLTRTYRTAGIGESALAAMLGEPLLRATNPVVATYAKADGVDVRITAVGTPDRTPAELLAEAEAAVLAAVAPNVWGHDGDTWRDVIGRQLDARGWTAALAEVGTGGSAIGLLAGVPWLLEARTLIGGVPAQGDGPATTADAEIPLTALAERARAEAGASVGLAVRATEADNDTRVDMVAVGPWGTSATEQVAFLGGTEGRRRAALALATFFHGVLDKV